MGAIFRINSHVNKPCLQFAKGHTKSLVALIEAGANLAVPLGL